MGEADGPQPAAAEETTLAAHHARERRLRELREGVRARPGVHDPHLAPSLLDDDAGRRAARLHHEVRITVDLCERVGHGAVAVVEHAHDRHLRQLDGLAEVQGERRVPAGFLGGAHEDDVPLERDAVVLVPQGGASGWGASQQGRPARALPHGERHERAGDAGGDGELTHAALATCRRRSCVWHARSWLALPSPRSLFGGGTECRPAPGSAQLRMAARIAGLAAILSFVTVVVVNFVIFEPLFIGEDPAQAARGIVPYHALFRVGLAGTALYGFLIVALSGALDAVLEPVDRTLALVATLSRLAYGFVWILIMADLFTALRLLTRPEYAAAFATEQVQVLAQLYLSGSDRYYLGLLSLSPASTIVGWLWPKSGSLPRALAVFGMVGSAGASRARAPTSSFQGSRTS